MDEILQDFLSILLIVQLIHLSVLDIKFQRISNYELLPLIMVAGLSIVLRLLSTEIIFYDFNIIFHIFHVGMSFYLYFTGFFGEADLKLSLVLFLVISPATNDGITNNLDGIQYYFFFFISLLFFFTFRLFLNLLISYRFKYVFNTSLSICERAFMYIFYQLDHPPFLVNSPPIILKINSQNVNIQIVMSKKKCSLCWVKKTTPMVPIVTLSVFLAVFT